MSKKDFKAKIAKKKARTAKKAAEAAKLPDKKNFWKTLFGNKKRNIIMGAVAAVLVVTAVVLLIVLGGGNDPKKAETGVKITEDFTHQVPEGLSADDIITMKNDETAKDFLRDVGGFNGMEPVPYEKGWFVFDSDGVARKYRDMEGEEHPLPVLDYKDSTMTGTPLLITGDVKMHFLVYRGEGVAVACYQYFILSDKADMTNLLSALEACDITGAVKVSDTVVEVVLDQTAISNLMDVVGLENTTTNFLSYLGEHYQVKR